MISQSIHLSSREAIWNKCMHRPASLAASVLPVFLLQRKYGCVTVFPLVCIEDTVQISEWMTDGLIWDTCLSECVWACVGKETKGNHEKKKKSPGSWKRHWINLSGTESLTVCLLIHHLLCLAVTMLIFHDRLLKAGVWDDKLKTSVLLYILFQTTTLSSIWSITCLVLKYYYWVC